MLLSIIIPMYNVELYIEQCLLSCLRQDIPASDYEIIVVNDGSPDGSLAIAERVASTASNIHIVSQPNGGLSVARNTGVKHAKGDYLWFVDSDDRIREYCLRSLMEQCERDHLDMLAVATANVIDGREVRRFSYTNMSVVSGGEVLDRGRMQHCVPFTIYRREFFLQHHLEFYPGIFHEDSEFSPRSYYYAKRVGFTNEVVYLVTINPNSITRSVNYRKSFDCLKVAISVHDFLLNAIKGEHATFYHNHISLMINNALSNFIKHTDDKELQSKEMKRFCKELYNNRYLFSHLRKSSLLKYKIEGYLFTLFPNFTTYIYKGLQMVKIRS
jgi:glycosyltransferase involved in cell wall biosynthesis